MPSEDDLTRGLMELATAFGRTVGDERWRKTIYVYRKVLRRLTDDQWTQAIGTSLEQDERFPTPGRLLSYSGVSRATRETKCEFCGLNAATLGDLCGDCALEDRKRARLGAAQPQHDRIESGLDDVVALVRRRPKRETERPSWYIHNLAVAGGLIQKGEGLFADAPQHGPAAQRAREPGEEG